MCSVNSSAYNGPGKPLSEAALLVLSEVVSGRSFWKQLQFAV